VKELWILRHAHAEPYRDEATDFARRLDPRGESEATAIGRLCAALHLDFDQIVTSPAARTLATAATVATALARGRHRIREEPGIYLADRKTLVALVRALPAECSRVLIVGHNPGVSRLAHWAIEDDSFGEIRPATLVGTRADIDLWTDADPGLFERLKILRPEDSAL
jgi:phosphohistidine phosphatase